MVPSKLNITPSTIPMMTLITYMKNVRANGLDISPDYQRGYIWSNDFKDQLILSIILNYPIGNIVINNLNTANSKNALQELVDGKQRLTTIFRFVQNGNVERWLDDGDDWFKLSKKNSEQAKRIIEKIVGDSDPEGIRNMNKAKRLSFKDLPASIQSNFGAYNVPVYTMQAADPAQIRNYFKVLQNQEKLKAGEIINALPENPMSPYFEKTQYHIFLEKLGFHYKRAEFEKVYYSMLGLWFGKLQMNSSDQNIIDFVENLKVLDSYKESIIFNLNAGINDIAAMSSSIQRHRTSKRTLKLLLGLALEEPGYFDNPDTVLQKVEEVCRFSDKLAAFNTSESDEVAFARYFGDEYQSNPDEFKNKRAPVYRRIFSVTTRSTNKDDFSGAIKTLKLMFSDSFEAAYSYHHQSEKP